MDYTSHMRVFFLTFFSVSKCLSDFITTNQNESSEITCNTVEKIRIDTIETNSTEINTLICNHEESYNCTFDYSSTQRKCDGQHSCTITGIDLSPVICLRDHRNISIRYPCVNGNVQISISSMMFQFFYRYCIRIFTRSFDFNVFHRFVQRCLYSLFKMFPSADRQCDKTVNFDSSCIYLPYSVNLSYSCVSELGLNETNVTKTLLTDKCTDSTIIGLMVGAVGMVGVLLGFVMGVCFSKRIQRQLCADKSPPQEEQYQGLESQQSTQQYDGLAAMSNNDQGLSEEMYNEVESPAIPQTNKKIRRTLKKMKNKAPIYGNL